MAQTPPIIHSGILTYQRDGHPAQVVVDSPGWYAWLQTASTFTFRSEHGSFTAHKEHEHMIKERNSSMSTEENKAFMHRVYEEVYNQRNLAVLDEVCVPDFVVHYPSRTLQGLEAYKHFVSLLFSAFPDGRYRIEDMIAEGDRVVVRHTFGGTHQGDFMGIPPTGKYVTTTAIVISRIANGKGIEAWINGDDLGRMQQLGVIPTLGEAG